MPKKLTQKKLDIKTSDVEAGPVECLGRAFESDDARRDYFIEELRKKLKDPDFRKTEGFPIGADEDILALSDPPYYTACPNPWVADFVKHYGRPYDKGKDKYHREPFAVDVSVGKTDALYKAHGYHTKVPHLAIVPSILHYTEPGDVVLDAFAGSGMTGVAAQWCGMASNAYRKELESKWRADRRNPPQWGMRRTVLNDLSPAATFIAANYGMPFDNEAFEKASGDILNELEAEIGWMYETLHIDGKTTGRIDYTVWSEVYACPECAGEVVFLEEALDPKTKRVRTEFPCPHCQALVTKKSLERSFVSDHDQVLGNTVRAPKRKPVTICYRVGRQSFEKTPDQRDLALLAKVAGMQIPTIIPAVAYPFDDMWEAPRLRIRGITHTHHLFLPRAAHALGALWARAKEWPHARTRNMLLFFIEQSIWGLSVLNRYGPTHFSQVNRQLSGVYYLASQISECSPWYNLGGKRSRLVKCMQSHHPASEGTLVTTGSATNIHLPDSSVDYVFTDPPFGDNLPYAELNFLVEAWHGVVTDMKPEAIVDRGKKNPDAQKHLTDYQGLMRRSFCEYYRVLKPGRWMTVVFSNTKAAVWNSIQSALQEAGFVVANVAALDKQQRSFSAVTTSTAVKQDLVISAYKPNGGLEDRFKDECETEDGVWDFVQTHLKNLPIAKMRGGELKIVAERDPRILYDRTVAFYVRHGIPVPLSSPEFQIGLADRFPSRHDMYFLPDQAAEFDKMRMHAEGLGQLTIFVEDERTAVDWLRQYLKRKPSKYQDVQPEFFQALTESWKRWETRPELRGLLESYFLCYHNEGEVPSQIHSHLSTDFKDMRKLRSDDPRLRAKAKDRWYVPDPKRSADVEMLRENRLLDEFWTYLPPGMDSDAMKKWQTGQTLDLPGLEAQLPPVPKGKRLKIVRTEAVRVGFSHCSRVKNYLPIVAVARYIPEDVVRNDDQLQMIVDLAEMRLGL